MINTILAASTSTEQVAWLLGMILLGSALTVPFMLEIIKRDRETVKKYKRLKKEIISKKLNGEWRKATGVERGCY